MIRLAFAFLLSLCVSAQAQLNGGGTGFPGPGTPAAVASYQGPGDVVSGALVFYSCSRVYNAAAASTSTNLCDLVAVTGGAAVCTLRGSSSGYVDQSAYCGGSTPSAACAAASGGSCKASKMYNQVSPGTLDVTQATLANMPGVVFSSSPSGTLPSIDCAGGTNALLATGTNPTIVQPWSMAAVVRRPAGVTVTGYLGQAAGTTIFVGSGGGNNLAAVAAGTTVTATASDNNWHAIEAVLNGTSSVITVDTTDNTGLNAGTTAWGANALRICRQGSGGSSWLGLLSEVGVWSNVGFTTGGGGQTQLMQANQHSAANGYNF